MEKPEHFRYGSYRANLYTLVGSIGAAMRMVEPYAQTLLVCKTGGRFQITGKNCPPQTGRNDFENFREKGAGYFVIVNGSEECTISVAPESQKYLLYSDVKRARS